LKKYLFLTPLFVLFFSACSSKEVYVPKKLDADWNKYEAAKYNIIDVSSNVALLDDRKVLTKEGVVDVVVDDAKRLVSQSGDWIITATMDGNVSLISQSDTKIHKEFELKKTVAGAAVKDDILAVIFADNEIALYDMDSKEILFKEQESKYTATDSRIVNPFFMKGLVLFATLDGKVVFVNLETKKRLRTVIVSSEDNFNNIISLHLLQNKIIAATSYKVLAMAQKQVRVKYEIRDIIYDASNIYLATKQGELLSLNSNLDVVAKIKFPFAHFYDMILNHGKLYILEKGGYIIVVDAKSFDYSVHQLNLDYNRINSKVYNDFINSNKLPIQADSIDIEDSYIFNDGKSFILNRIKILTE